MVKVGPRRYVSKSVKHKFVKPPPKPKPKPQQSWMDLLPGGPVKNPWDVLDKQRQDQQQQVTRPRGHGVMPPAIKKPEPVTPSFPSYDRQAAYEQAGIEARRRTEAAVGYFSTPGGRSSMSLYPFVKARHSRGQVEYGGRMGGTLRPDSALAIGFERLYDRVAQQRGESFSKARAISELKKEAIRSGMSKKEFVDRALEIEAHYSPDKAELAEHTMVRGGRRYVIKKQGYSPGQVVDAVRRKQVFVKQHMAGSLDRMEDAVREEVPEAGQGYMPNPLAWMGGLDQPVLEGYDMAPSSLMPPGQATFYKTDNVVTESLTRPMSSAVSSKDLLWGGMTGVSAAPKGMTMLGKTGFVLKDFGIGVVASKVHTITKDLMGEAVTKYYRATDVLADMMPSTKGKRLVKTITQSPFMADPILREIDKGVRHKFDSSWQPKRLGAGGSYERGVKIVSGEVVGLSSAALFAGGAIAATDAAVKKMVGARPPPVEYKGLAMGDPKSKFHAGVQTLKPQESFITLKKYKPGQLLPRLGLKQAPSKQYALMAEQSISEAPKTIKAGTFRVDKLGLKTIRKTGAAKSGKVFKISERGVIQEAYGKPFKYTASRTFTPIGSGKYAGQQLYAIGPRHPTPVTGKVGRLFSQPIKNEYMIDDTIRIGGRKIIRDSYASSSTDVLGYKRGVYQLGKQSYKMPGQAAKGEIYDLTVMQKSLKQGPLKEVNLRGKFGSFFKGMYPGKQQAAFKTRDIGKIEPLRGGASRGVITQYPSKMSHAQADLESIISPAVYKAPSSSSLMMGPPSGFGSKSMQASVKALAGFPKTMSRRARRSPVSKPAGVRPLRSINMVSAVVQAPKTKSSTGYMSAVDVVGLDRMFKMPSRRVGRAPAYRTGKASGIMQAVVPSVLSSRSDPLGGPLMARPPVYYPRGFPFMGAGLSGGGMGGGKGKSRLSRGWWTRSFIARPRSVAEFVFGSKHRVHKKKRKSKKK